MLLHFEEPIFIVQMVLSVNITKSSKRENKELTEPEMDGISQDSFVQPPLKQNMLHPVGEAQDIWQLLV